MVSRILRVLPVVACVLISACSTFPTQSYNKAATGNPKSIAIAPMGLPEKPHIQILAPVGANFGIIGAAIEAGRMAAAAEEGRLTLEKANLSYQSYLPAQIASSMQSAGFDVKPLPGERANGFRMKFLTDIPAENGADAVLDLYVRYLGFIAAGATTDYRPAVKLDAKLVRSADKKVLFADQIYYNNFEPGIAPKAVTLEPDPTCAFKDREALQADPERTAACLKGGMDAVATELAKQFK